MPTAARCLSRAACLKRFDDLLPEMIAYAAGTKDISQLGNEEWIVDSAFKISIITHLSSSNHPLQGNKLCRNLDSIASAFSR